MELTRAQAYQILIKYVSKNSLISHCLSVEAAMNFYANWFNEPTELWKICGLLHDFDYEIHPDANRHPKDGAVILRESNVPEEIILAILSHGTNSGIPRNTNLRKVLFACDEITGLITACALVRPSKSILDMQVGSIKKKWKNKAFASGANRDEMIDGAQLLGISLWDHVSNVLKAMQSIATDISLDGSAQKQD